MSTATAASVDSFIQRWQKSGAAERANYQLFLTELCDILDVPRPDPSRESDADNAYVFERAVTFQNGDGTTSAGRIDLYKRNCFVLEAKQGAERDAPFAATERRRRGTALRGTDAWDNAMLRAKGQAEGYVRALPPSEGRPPLLIVVDVGHSIELFSEFTRTGGMYVPFPDPRSHRLFLGDLAKPEVCETLRQVWTDPAALDPARRSARVTREIADRLAGLAKSLEASGHAPQAVAQFLMRCLFTMFAEDVGLLGKGGFVGLLRSLHKSADHFVPIVEELWNKMKTGGFSTALRETVLRFNGGLFENATALPIDTGQLERLTEAATADWRDVEPAIFGTLLERALDPVERHKLGAHYTPRAYVERLVIPTVVEPLRDEWNAVQAAAYTLARQDKVKDARAEVETFHRRLCDVRVLDPACGSGNFLYVTLEHLKRLEGEVLNTLRDLGEPTEYFEMGGVTVDPHQLLGLEINPRAAAIAELVLWIGYLQWHFRTRGEVTPPEPVIKNFHNIECRDAVLEWDREEDVLDEHGQPVTRWDGRTYKKHPVTGEDVPDDTARVTVKRYINPRKAEWPQAEFVVGNPPFVGNKRMRLVLGSGYVDAVRELHTSLPDTVDYVMYWWDRAATLTRAGHLFRFGLITTNSITQTFNRPVLEQHLFAGEPLSLAFAVPDHPWVESTDGAAVRIAMTVGTRGRREGLLCHAVKEEDTESDEKALTLRQRIGIIHPDLSTGPNVVSAVPLRANGGICFQGFILVGEGFCITRNDFPRFGLEENALPRVVRRWKNGKDLLRSDSGRFAIDFFGLDVEQARDKYPQLFQHLLATVKPVRDTVNRKNHRERWWIWGEARPGLRRALAGLTRFVATVETSKHKPFVFLPSSIGPDHKLYAVAADDALVLGVLSSRTHGVWALAAGGRIGYGNDPTWTNTTCFLPFPFPDASEGQKARIRELGEALDAHRKRQQALHPTLTMTDMYNVLEKLRSGEALTAREKTIHEQGLVSVLKQIHDDLDAAVFEAYGWPATLTDEEILERLVKLNAERAEEERRGLVRWLRPEFQNPQGAAAVQTGLEVAATDAATRPAAKKAATPFPAKLAEQVQAVRAALAASAAPADAPAIAARFKGARANRIAEILETLVSLGQARQLDNARYLAQ